jgi:hypothetical protein
MRLVLLVMLILFGDVAFAADGGFLFVTFKGEQSPMTEQIHFVVSKDGRKWEAVNGAQPTLVSNIGEQGVRDPFLLRSHDGQKFFLIATDLSINLNRDWGRAVRAGSKSIVIWESSNLIDWSEPRLAKVAPDDAGCTWAPEAIYNPASKKYLVFWASTTQGDNFAKHRIWAADTADFRTFGKPFIYIEKPTAIIDTTIVRNEKSYYRFSKDEKFKAITMEVAEDLMGPWRDVSEFSLAKLQGYEGPECYRMGASWCLILDHYSQGKGYQPFVTSDLAGGQFSPGEGFSLPFRLRHGSILPLKSEEYERLVKAYRKS